MTLTDPHGLKKCKINKDARDSLKALKAQAKKLWGATAHRHHIVMEKASQSWGAVGQKYVTDAQGILKKFDVDIHSLDNVVYAPNKGHSIEYAKEVLDAISPAKSAYEVRKALADLADSKGWLRGASPIP